MSDSTEVPCLVEFQGRLARADKRPANPGRYTLLFRLHPAEGSERVEWEESVADVEVTPGGFFNVVLGLAEPLAPDLFESGPLWLSVRVSRESEIGDEHGARVPLVGSTARLGWRLAEVAERVGQLEEAIEVDGASGGRDKLVNRLSHLREWLDELRERVASIESGQEAAHLRRRMDAMGIRIDDILREGGRLDRIEDELEDLVGPDGDVVDLNERMDRIEGQAPDLIARLRAREAGPSEDRIDVLSREVEHVRAAAARIDQAMAEQAATLAALAQAGPPTAESLGAIRRGGDVMTGGLTINRGGLEVLSGGVTCRGANVTTLEASNLVKSPKGIFDAVELRGDLTFDNTRRAIQCRLVEGRQGSSRKDGALFLNSRGGAEVVIGNPEAAKGAQVHGPVSTDAAQTTGTCIALALALSGEGEAGDVVRIDDNGRAARSATAADPGVCGVIAAAPGVLLGGPLSAGRVAVAVQGVVPCKVDASVRPVRPGDLLEASDVPGHARPTAAPAPGTVVAKAMGSLSEGRGTITVLLWGR